MLLSKGFANESENFLVFLLEFHLPFDFFPPADYLHGLLPPLGITLLLAKCIIDSSFEHDQRINMRLLSLFVLNYLLLKDRLDALDEPEHSDDLLALRLVAEQVMLDLEAGLEMVEGLGVRSLQDAHFAHLLEAVGALQALDSDACAIGVESLLQVLQGLWMIGVRASYTG